MIVTEAVVGGVLAFIAAVGCIVPVLPGPLIAYAALWLLYAFGCPLTTNAMIVATATAIGVTVVDYILPSICAKKFHCSGLGVFGCFLGSIVGVFFIPWGIIMGPFIGTVAGEIMAGKNLSDSLRGGLGSLLGFVFCLVLNLDSVAFFTPLVFALLCTAGA